MLLTLMIFVPLIGMIVVLCLPRNAEETIKRATLVFTLIPLILGVILLAGYDRASEDSQYAVKMMWIEAFKIHYHIGIDGLSVTLILLTVLLGPICVIASWRNIEKGIKAYMALFLLLETGMIGFFAALDLFLFYVFFELTLLPMYFLIGIWGGPRREYAAIKFFLYTLFGSVLMLIAMIAVYLKGGTFDIPTLITYAQQPGHASQQPGISDLGLPRFLYRIRRQSPDFPLPHVASRRARRSADSHQCYSCGNPPEDGNVRGLFESTSPCCRKGWLSSRTPSYAKALGRSATWGYGLAILGFINIVYGSFCALAQTDFKKLVAYSSIGHMGFVILGLAARNESGVTGAILQMFNHGVISAMLFLLVGVVYDRAHHREINGFGGLGSKMPIYTGITTLAFMASLGLPGLSGFVGEALALLGAYSKYQVLTILSTIGIVVGAAYFLWTLQRVFLGKLNPKYEGISEINGREILTLVPLGILTIVFGVCPSLLINMFNQAVSMLPLVP